MDVGRTQEIPWMPGECLVNGEFTLDSGLRTRPGCLVEWLKVLICQTDAFVIGLVRYSVHVSG